MGMMRYWAEITVTTEPAWMELVAAALEALGAGGVVMLGGPSGDDVSESIIPCAAEAPGVRAYLPADDTLGERLALLRRRLAEARREGLEIPYDITLRRVAEEDWAEAWKAHYHPVKVGAVTIVPSWEEYSPGPGETVLRLDPGLAFGAGTHPTTRQALLLLERHLRPGERVLDLGTGCGILAIAAARLGAGPVLARDIDPVAVEVAGENTAANGLAGRIAVERGDLLTGLAGPYELVLANLVAPLLLELLPSLPGVMAKEGRAVLAGIIAGRAEEVRGAVAKAGLVVLEEMVEGEWVAMGVGRRVE